MTAPVSEAPARWWSRAVGLALDVLPGAAVAVTMALTALTVPIRGGWWWFCVAVGGLAVLLSAANRSLLPAITGWTPAPVIFLVAALLCLMGATVSYLAVYRYDQRTDQARAQIATEGPKIVVRVLSYKPESLPADFERARSLVTENYRAQVVGEQQAVQKRKPVPNEYWATDGSVLSASPRRAAMLLFLQGQRGEAGKERPISATVRANFVNSAAHWRLDDLTVLSKPAPAGAGN